MRGIIIGIVIGCVVGVMFGATVIAPRLEKTGSHFSGPVPVKSNPATLGDALEQAARAITPETPITLPPAGPQRSVERWRMASAYPGSQPLMGKLASRIGRNLWNVSDGGMEIKFFEPGSLVPVKGMFDAVSSGAIDSAFGTVDIWADKAPALNLFAAIPFGPGAEEYLAWMYFGDGQKSLNEIYRPFNIHGILCGMIPPVASGWFRSEFTGPEDLKGLKISSSGLGAMVLAKLGVLPRKIEQENIFMAFENGAIDAAEFSLPSVDLELGFNDLASHYYFPGWRQPAAFHNLIVNKDKWDGLSKSRQSQIEAVCGDNVRRGLAEGEAMQYDALKKLTTKGVKIHRWSRPILAALEAAWKNVQAEQSAADADFRRIWRSLEEFRKNYSTWSELSRP